ncbi:MAG: response regulator transcription factor [Elusimicrobiaceae bacterium]
MKYKIMVVDDEVSLLKGVRERLELENFDVITCTCAEQANAELARSLPDVIVLDVRLPGMNGFDLCKKIRAGAAPVSAVPILFLTTVSDESYKVLGLELGGDDYITKPFSPAELVARLRAIIRRNTRQQAETSDEEVLHTENLVLNTGTHMVTVNDGEINLSPKEFTLLYLLLKKKERVLSRSFLMDSAWEKKYDQSSRTVDTHIKSLRKKLGKTGARIKTVEGLGYKWSDD